MTTRLLTKSEELDLARNWLDRGCEKSRKKLILAYTPMIRSMARQFMRPGLSRDDLVQEGIIGFIGGLENFEPARGHSVGTLARFHVAARMQLFLAEFSGAIRLPNSRKIKGLVTKCVAQIRLVESEIGESLPDRQKEMICQAAGFTLSELHDYECVMKPSKSLCASSDDEQGFDIPDDAADGAHVLSQLASVQASEILQDVLGSLPERTRRILAMRYLSDEFTSLETIAETVGVSRERVRKIEIDALREIRKRLSQDGISTMSDLI